MAEIYTCPWCRHVGDAGTTSCTNCGAPVDLREATTDSGWIELPPVKDMARIQFGQSSCQIEGTYVPVADMNLAGDESVHFNHHTLLWKEPQIQLEPMSLKGGFKRMMAGLPLIMLQGTGIGHVALSEDRPGELIPVPLDPGWSVDVREHHFLVSTGSIAYDYFKSDVWFTTRSGDDTETHYPLGQYMDRFTAVDRPGFLLLHAGGNVFLRGLADGETIFVKPPALLFKDPTVQAWLHLEHPRDNVRSWRAWGSRYLWLAVRGPGRVAIQSAYERLEDPGTNLSRTSPSTTSRW